jgi:hypothetical protein
MDAAAWQKAKPLIADALELPPSQRGTFLESRCADPALRAEIRAYLESGDQPTTPNRPDSPDLRDASDGADLLPGAYVGHGRYVIVGHLGRGGMGQVYLAEDVQLRRRVALKRLLGSKSRGAHEHARIVREARAAAQVNQVNVATVYDVIEHEGRTLIVMEYVQGESLAALMRRERLAPERVVTIGIEIAAALVAAHEKGVIHLDLKPANIQLTMTGVVKVLDFGVAGATAAFTTVSEEGSQDDTGSVQPGTRGYMSPEQMVNRHVDERSDIFSAGIVLFEMATGERAFPDTEPLALAVAIGKPVRRADAVDARVPRGLADVIARALEVDLVRRFHSAADLAAALDALRTRTAGGTVVVEPAARPALGRRVRRVLAVTAAAAGMLTGFGFLTSRAFNLALELTGFDHDSVLDWFRLGLESCVAPLAVVALVIVALAVLAVLRNLVLSLWPGTRRLEATSRGRLTTTARRLRLDDMSVLASWVLLISTFALVASWWHFWPLLRAAFSQVSTASAESLELLAPIPDGGPAPARHFDGYRAVEASIAFFSGAAWWWMSRRLRRSGQSLGWVISAGGWVVGALALISLSLPYRLVYQSKFDTVKWGDVTCYRLGARAGEVALFCPTETPRRQTVSSDVPLLVVGTGQNLFEPFSRPR